MSEMPLIDVDLWSDEVLANPYPTYARLRAHSPVFYDVEHEVFVLTRYDEIRSATQDWQTFSSAQGIGVSARGNRRSGHGILTTDPPRHDQLRAVLNRQLVPQSVARHQAFLSATAHEIVAKLADRKLFDVVVDLAQRYSIEVVGTLCGLPDEGRDRYMAWADAGFNVTGPDNELCNAAYTGFFEMYDYAFNVVTPDRLAPGGWGSEIYEAGAEGTLDAESCPGLIMAYVWAGMDTTVNGIASAVWLFANHPDQWARVRQDRSVLGKAVAEVLRIEPPVQRFTRVATRTVEIAGVTVPEGSRIVLLFGSANRDERRFAEPDRFDVDRNPVDHLAFGRGIHRCVGAGLAQQEMSAVLDALAEVVERFDIVEATWRRNNGLHGLERLIVRA